MHLEAKNFVEFIQKILQDFFTNKIILDVRFR